MKNYIKMSLLGASAVVLAACGEAVNVESNEVAVRVTSTGVIPEIIEPSRFRLNFCTYPGARCDSLIKVQTTDSRFVENMSIFMPRDQLTLHFEIRGLVGIRSDSNTIMRLVSRVTGERHGHHRYINIDHVYNTYAEHIITTVARDVVAEYSIEEVNSNRDEISSRIYERVSERLEGMPIQISNLALGNVQMPDVVISAREKAEERRVEIEQGEAQREIDLIHARTRRDVALADQERRLIQAETIKLENEVVAASVTPQYIMYRTLEVQELMANNQNAVFFPMEFAQTSNATDSFSNAMFTGQLMDEMQKRFQDDLENLQEIPTTRVE